MKRLKAFLFAVAAVSMLTLTGCVKDISQEEKPVEEIGPTENTLGFSAPDGFDWSMLSTINLNVEVKDEFNGQYNYLVEVFAVNPIFNEDATPIAAGYAKGGEKYTASLTLAKTTERIFIRQTDPKQRKSVRQFNLPQSGSTLNCKMYDETTTTRAANNTKGTVGTSGWSELKNIPDYKEETYTVPSTSASIINGNQLPAGSTYVIKKGETFEGVLHSYNDNNPTNTTVFVAGTWDVTGDRVTPQGVNIIVLDGGKITASSGYFMVSDKSNLTIQTGGTVDCKTFATATHVTVKNFGKFHAEKIDNFNTGTVLYNAENGIFEVGNGIFKLTSSEIYNHGIIKMPMTSGSKIDTNNSNNCIIANYENASIEAYEISSSATLVNSGLITAHIFSDSSVGGLYNNCTIVATKSFICNDAILDHGSITAGYDQTTQEWKPVPEVKSLNTVIWTLKNSSIIKATEFTTGSPHTIIGESAKSMIKAKTINCQWTVYLKGNLVWEGTNVYPKGNSNSLQFENTVEMAGYNSSTCTITNCSGTVNEGNPGTPTPVEPEYPIEVGSAGSYTYAFENQWPIYGDFDMNDVVVGIEEFKLMGNGNHRSIKISGQIYAVGAGKQVGVGIRLLKVNTSEINSTEAKTQSTGGNKQTISLEGGQTNPVVIICDDAHKFCGNPSGDRTFINTVKGGKTNEPENFEVWLYFNGRKDAEEAFDINNLDVFIINQADTRSEVHVAGFSPTDKADRSKFGKGNDRSNTKDYYVSEENLAWGICIPGNSIWAWPQEYKNIKDVYRKFQSWVTSGGKNDKDWATTDYDGNLIYKQ